MTKLSEATLDRLVELSAGATAGRWRHRTELIDPPPIVDYEEADYEVIHLADEPLSIIASELDLCDAEFIVAARDYLPQLVREFDGCALSSVSRRIRLR